MKYHIIIITTILVFINNSFAISPLSETEMKTQTGQAGISIGIDNAVIYHEQTSVKLIDADETDAGYLAFKDIKQLYTYNTGNTDVDSDGYMGHLLIDIINKNNESGFYPDPYLSVSCEDWASSSYLKVDEIDFNGHNIGSLSITETTLPKWNVFLGAHEYGFDIEAGFQLKTDSLKYRYGSNPDQNYIGFDNIYFAETFTDSTGTQPSTPSDPSTWNAKGKFKVGDFSSDSPATLDICTRPSDDSPIIQFSAPIAGSIRIENIHAGQNNFGPAAIDGIKVHRMTIEIPGRDLGNI